MAIEILCTTAKLGLLAFPFEDREGLMQFKLQEPGLKAAKQEEERGESFDPAHCLFEIVCCPFKINAQIFMDHNAKLKVEISAKLKWIPPKHPSSVEAGARAHNSPMAVVSAQPHVANHFTVEHKSKYHVRYEAIDGDELLTNEGMSKILD